MKTLLLFAIIALWASNVTAQWQLTNCPQTIHKSDIAYDGNSIFVSDWGASTSNEIHKSTDNGNTWTSASSGLPLGQMSSIAVDGANIFVSTFWQGIYLSNNNGNSWAAVNNGVTFPTLEMRGLGVWSQHLYAIPYFFQIPPFKT